MEEKVRVECKFCNETHEIRPKTYDKNVARNGHYVCERENGSRVGKKFRKQNPHAAEGKKQCTKCADIKLMEEFGRDKNRSDGYSAQCKECRKS